VLERQNETQRPTTTTARKRGKRGGKQNREKKRKIEAKKRAGQEEKKNEQKAVDTDDESDPEVTTTRRAIGHSTGSSTSLTVQVLPVTEPRRNITNLAFSRLVRNTTVTTVTNSRTGTSSDEGE